MIQFFPSLLKLGLDPDAIAFFKATGITDSTQKNSVNYLVKELKKENLWSKVLGLYPFVGGTAFTHKFNLKDPRDLNAAFRLSFFGTITHSSDGVKGDGATGYYNTHLRNVDNLPTNDTSFGVYITDDIDVSMADIGYRVSTVSAFGSLINARSESNQAGFRFNSNLIQINNNDSRGFYIASRNNSNNFLAAKNTNVTILISSSQVFSNFLYYGLARNVADTSFDLFSTRNQAFAWFGFGITETEIVTLYNIVQQFQTILGRQV